jgi:hypothetical protein
VPASSPGAYFSVPSRVVMPVSTLMRRLAPLAPITRRRSATGLKSTTARPPLSKGSDRRDTCVARPVAGSMVTIWPAS